MSTPIASPPFDVCGPLPEGLTVLEASAGTGKTYAIAALAARYIAEGVVELEDMLIVTFGRMATAELRDRVRERLVSVEEGLERALHGVRPDGSDRVLSLLADGSPEQLELRLERISRAVSDFDAATIATIHGFCQDVLSEVGIAGDLEPDSAFVEDLSDLVAEVVDDLYVRRFRNTERPPFSRAKAGRIARAANDNPGAPIEPSPATSGSAADTRARLAQAVRDEVEVRKRRLGVMTYDDLLTRLDDALHAPGGEAIAERLRSRYRVVLVDEFQDTDPIQWSIFRDAFAGGDGTLVLIGDPKQAIYAFRGADVYAYLDAVRTAGARPTLDVNWRSDQPLLDAYDALFGDARLGHEGIVYRRVRAAGDHLASRLTGAPRPEPLRIRVVDRGDPSVGTTAKGYAATNGAREHIAEDLALDVVSLLSSGATIEGEGVEPGDVAVLVRRNMDAELVRDALADVGVPAVLNGAGSVFDTRAAGDWLRLLEAIERPSSESRAHVVALSSFVGWSAAQIAAADDAAWETVHARLHRWAGVLRRRGVAALAETVTIAERLPERVLARTDGERHLTDLRHIAELLHAVAMEEQLGATALTTWLRRRIDAAADELDHEERSRRLESDSDAVQVLTIHRSKGLEFPIVYLPFLWHPSPVDRAGDPVAFHDPDDGNRRKVDVGLEGTDYHAHRAQSVVEQRGEDLRLMYVGLTRARHQAVVWWAGAWDSRNSPLGRLVFCRGEDGTVAVSGDCVPADGEARSRFGAIASGAPAGRIAVEESSLRLPATWSGPLPESAELDAAVFDRELDWRWRRTSYSDITSQAHEAFVASEPEEREVEDEPALADDGAGEAGAGLLDGMPVGVDFGTFVHRVFEATDFAAGDLRGELATRVDMELARRRVEVGDVATLVDGLAAAIETPLGPLVDGVRLRDLARANRLDELGFELPLAGGDSPRGSVTLSAIAAALGRDPVMARYAERLHDPALRQSFRGYLNGSIDLVLRVGGRFAVVDYKTNRLSGPGGYRPSALAVEMERMHYVLQALLYTVALHRFLRWRLPAYDVERHLAGAIYLFVRGAVGPGTPVLDGAPCGVFGWRPPASVVVELSDVLDGGAR